MGARPVARVATAAAERNETFRKVCVRVAYLNKPSERVTMSEGHALQVGCTLLGEAVVFTFSGTVLVYEYHRNREAEQLKHQMEQRKQEEALIEIKTRLSEIHDEVVAATQRVVELEKVVAKQQCSLDQAMERATNPWWYVWSQWRGVK